MALNFVSLEVELKKNNGLKVDDLEGLLEWNRKQAHLPKMSIEHLVLFLQSCYFRCEAAKVAIENYFTIRSDAPEIFGSVSSAAVYKMMDVL